MLSLTTLLAITLCADFLPENAQPTADLITIHKRLRDREPGGEYTVRDRVESWDPKQTAIIVCDMWDAHHCLNAVRRAEEMAPRMNEVLEKARNRGVFIIHAPSSCM